MECGLPVVAFDCKSGPGEIISHGKDGFLVPAQDVTQLANAMQDLINNLKLRKGMATQAIQTAKKYQINNIMKQWIALYQSLKTK